MSLLDRRASGILLHPTSFPGRYGIGDLGKCAYDFIDFLVGARQRYWQILPLGPTGYGESPYQCLSAFAGNTLLISLDDLAERGWLDRTALDAAPEFPQRVDYGAVIAFHNEMLEIAYQGYLAKRTPEDQEAFAVWLRKSAYWAQDFALFMTFKEAHALSEWTRWPKDERDYTRAVTKRDALRERYEEHLFRQWMFYTQWGALKQYANERNIEIIGDLPIFVAHDSSDVWSKRELFFLDGAGMPPVVTGVPPDYFSQDGQRWGHPVYTWAYHQKTGFAWWLSRIRAALELVDVVRIDHFRGFWDYFEVPATDLLTTKNGRWLDGPRDALFNAVAGDVMPRIIAEDLGDNMGAVIAWRERLGLPGMKILQFAFGGSADEQRLFGPDRIEPNAVVYTGTHDNNTTLGWYKGDADDRSRANMNASFERLCEQWVQQHDTPAFEFAGADLETPTWKMIRLGMMSGGNTVVTPLQDLLAVDASGRMNRPGDPDLSQNWRWRYTDGDLTDGLRDLYRKLTEYHLRAE